MRKTPFRQWGGVHDRFGGVEGAAHGEVGGFEAVDVVRPGGEGELGARGGGELVGEDVGYFGEDDASLVAPGVQRHADEQGVQGDGAVASGVRLAGALLRLVDQGDDAGAVDELAGPGEVGRPDASAALAQLLEPGRSADVVVRAGTGTVGGGHGISLRVVWACSALMPLR